MSNERTIYIIENSDGSRQSGIYVITNTVNGHFYIGQAQNIKKRWRSHRTTLRRGEGRNEHLQRAWDKYGEGVFEFRTLICCDIEELDAIENFFLKKYVGTPKCYNSAIEAGTTRGIIPSEETRAKMSKARSGERNGMFGKTHSDVTRTKISESKIGIHSGEGNPNARLNLQAVNDIRMRYEKGEANSTQLANEYGVSQSTICRIIGNEIWR